MKNHILYNRAILCFSAIFFWTGFIRPTLHDVALCAVMGLLSVIILFNIHPQKCSGAAEMIGALAGILVGCLSYCHICRVWQYSSKIEMLAGYLECSYGTMLRIIALVASIGSFPVLRLFGAVLADGVIRGSRNIRFHFILKAVFQKVRKSGIRVVCKAVLFDLAAAMMGILLLCGCFLLPTGESGKNMESSAKVLSLEETHFSVYNWCHSILDNYTDSIMLLEASDQTESSVVDRAMMAYRGTIHNAGNPWDTLIRHYAEGEEFDEVVSYPRYWHGYLVLLRPMLSAFDYSEIRMINQVGQLLLLCFVSFLLWRKQRRCMMPFLLSWLMLMPVALGKSLQFSSCFYVILFGTALVLTRRKTDSDSMAVAFIVIGIATAFFDFLTYPIATFGVPAVIMISEMEGETTEKKILWLLFSGMAWAFGYAGMWASKWVIGSMITNTDILQNALRSVAVRASAVSGSGEHITIGECYSRNIRAFLDTPFVFPGLFVLCSALVSCLQEKRLPVEIVFQMLLPYLLVGVLPFVWYIVARNHSFAHSFFTCKALVVTCLAMLCGMNEVKKKNSSQSCISEIE